MTASILLRVCAASIFFFGIACTATWAQVDMSDGFDFENPEHIDVVVPKIVTALEPEAEQIEICVAVTRLHLAGVGMEDGSSWFAVNYVNRVWEAELKSAVDQGDDSLLQLFTANRRVDWPKQLLTFEMHQKFGPEGLECGNEILAIANTLDWSEFE